MFRAKLFSTILSFALAGTAAAELELISPQAVQRPESGNVDNPDIALLRSATDWISHVFRLPKMQNSPKVQRFSGRNVCFRDQQGLHIRPASGHRGHELSAHRPRNSRLL